MTISRRQILSTSARLRRPPSAPRAAFGAGPRSGKAIKPISGHADLLSLRSGALEKHGIKFEEIGVPSGNQTMQQMVARQWISAPMRGRR